MVLGTSCNFFEVKFKTTAKFMKAAQICPKSHPLMRLSGETDKPKVRRVAGLARHSWSTAHPCRSSCGVQPWTPAVILVLASTLQDQKLALALVCQKARYF